MEWLPGRLPPESGQKESRRRDEAPVHDRTPGGRKCGALSRAISAHGQCLPAVRLALLVEIDLEIESRGQQSVDHAAQRVRMQVLGLDDGARDVRADVVMQC